MPTIAVVNQKGGVGKTTVALGVASAAVHRGLRVAVVDLNGSAIYRKRDHGPSGYRDWKAQMSRE